MMSSSPSASSPHILILGGGIVSLCTAHSLLTSPHLPPASSVTIVEPHRLAHGASGRAMGMIGREWQPAQTLPLSRLSWDCYAALEGEFGGRDRWDWRRAEALGVEVTRGARLSFMRELTRGDRKRGGGAVGTDGKGDRGVLKGEVYEMDSGENVASIHPGKFCAFLQERCTSLGLQVIHGNPTAIDRTAKTVTVAPSSSTTPASDPPSPAELQVPYTRVLIAAGPWSAHLCSALSLPRPRISNLPGHSVVIKPAPGWHDETLSGKSIFAGIRGGAKDAVDEIAWHGGEQDDRGEAGGEGYTPSIELVYRPDGTVYVAGENGVPSRDPTELPNHLTLDPSGVESLVDPQLVRRLLRSSALLSDGLDVGKGAEVVTAQLCFRPTTPDGTALIGPLTQGEEEVFIAAGHGPWGITLAPGTGKVMADMLLGQRPSVPIASFRPWRFRA